MRLEMVAGDLPILAVLGRAQHVHARHALAARRGQQVRRARGPLRAPLPPLGHGLLALRDVLRVGAVVLLLLLLQQLRGDVVVGEQAGEQLGRAVVLDLVDLVGVRGWGEGLGLGLGGRVRVGVRGEG